MEELDWAIDKQDTTDKCMDLDKLHPMLLKRLGNTAKLVLLQIFNLALKNKIWLWDCSAVSFIRKEGKSTYTDPGSYRPISIASYFGKIMERIVAARVNCHIIEQGDLDDEQEGFQSGRSTTRYLYRLLANLEEVKRQKLTCMVLFLDFEKAFDSVYIPKLIVKLSKLGIKGNLLHLINDFLVNRKVSLRVNNHWGPKRACKLFGLPQGSALSPLLFIIFINDMFHRTQQDTSCQECTNIYKYADDGSITITHKDPQECHRIAQKMCDNLSQWCANWQLKVNCEKIRLNV